MTTLTVQTCENCHREFVGGRRVTCSQRCANALRHKKAHGRKLYHDWLPADDEANISGYWVPTPEEIQRQCVAIRKANSVLRGEVDWLELTMRERAFCTKKRMQERRANRA